MTTVARRKDPLQYIPIDDTIDKYNLDRDNLLAAIEDGQIEIAEIVGSDTTLLLDESLRAWLSERVNRDQFNHLDGPISATDAAKKYGFTYRSIMNWVERGHIKDLGLAPGYKRRRLVNEADVAYARRLADLKQPISGQSVFP